MENECPKGRDKAPNLEDTLRTGGTALSPSREKHSRIAAPALKQLRPIGKGDQELEKRLDQKELT
jgi:hypothetical protein